MNYYNYFTEIEQHFVWRRGTHLYVSPLDWSLIASWRDSGVPLHVALRGIDKAMDSFAAKRSRNSSKVNTLFYCHDSVLEEHDQYLEAHRGERAKSEVGDPGAGTITPADNEASGPPKADLLQFLNRRIFEIKTRLAKQSPGGSTADALGHISARLEEIARDLEPISQVDAEALERDLSILDGLLIKELQPTIPQETMAEWGNEAKTELRLYKKRLPKETYRKILDNFLRSKIHKHCEIGELSLFHL